MGAETLETSAGRVIREVWPTISQDLEARRLRGEDLAALAVVIAGDGDGLDSMIVSREEAGEYALRMGAFRVAGKLARRAPSNQCWVVVIVGGEVWGGLVSMEAGRLAN
ncbi:hypothetical protein [Sorangium sp. So ce394]|uniref:hypothetical protein n=1 Tax=Sorangium sp. So ce394 TaxID=3133310 RepID=UPI003F5C2E35